MKKITYLICLLFTLSSLANDSASKAKELYDKRGESEAIALESLSLYKSLIEQTSDPLTKCDYLNQAAYLSFFIGSRKNDEDQEDKMMKESISFSISCFNQYGTNFKVDDYKHLNETERRTVSLALSYYGTALARSSEIAGYLKVIERWPTINSAMKLIIDLGTPEPFSYAAHRARGIANYKMPPPFGSKRRAFQFLNYAVDNSKWPGKNISLFIFNSISLADAYKSVKELEKACSILKEILELTEEEILKDNPELFYETTFDLKRAKSLHDQFNC